MSAVDTLRDALFGNPPSATTKPSREGALAAFTELYDAAVVAQAAAVAGITIVPTTAARDAFYATSANQSKLVYVNNNNGSATDPANGVYEYAGGSPRIAQSFYNGLTAAVLPSLERTQNLAGATWLDPGAITGDLPEGSGWTDAKEALARAIKLVRLNGAATGERYFVSIFTNNASGSDIIAISRGSDGGFACSSETAITKNPSGLTQVMLTGAQQNAVMWVDYRDLGSFTGAIVNSTSPGPLWLALSTSDTLADSRLLAVENAALKLRNEAINGGLDPDGQSPTLVGATGGVYPYKVPAADMAVRGVSRSVSIGPEATGIIFLFKDEPLSGTVAGQYFATSHYVYASDPADFPAQTLVYPLVGSDNLPAVSSAQGFEQITTNLRRYWTIGQFPNNSAITGVRYGPGAKLAHAAEASGFTWRRSSSPITINDIRADDWQGYIVSERALGAVAQDVSGVINGGNELTPYVGSNGALRGRGVTTDTNDTDEAADTKDIMIAPAVGVIRGVSQTGSAIRWVDDGLTRRRSFDLRALDEIAGLGVTRIVFKPMIGQSLSVGTAGYPVVTSTTPWPGRVFMFNGGTRVLQGNVYDNLHVRELDDGQMQRLVPLVESLPPNGVDYGETQGGGEAWIMGASGGMAATEIFAFATFGVGGMGIAGLGKGTVPYSNMVRGIERIAAMAALYGIEVVVPAVDWIQGEADYETAASAYTTALLQLQADTQADIRAILGTTATVPLMIRQPSSWSAYGLTQSVAMLAVLDAAIANPARLLMAGPQYSTGNYADGVHKNAAGYRREGEYIGKATRDFRNGGSTGALYATSAVNSGTTVTITFNATSQLVIDTTLVSDPGQRGLRLIGPNGTTIALSNITASGSNKITATAASALTAGQTYIVGIADVGVAGQPGGTTTGPRSNIRDSSTQAASTGANLYAWAHHQRLSFTAT